MESRHFKLFVSVFLLLAIFYGVGSLYSGRVHKPTGAVAAPIQLTKPGDDITVTSPDGKLSMIVKSKRLGSTNIWAFYIGETKIISLTLPSESKLEVPDNAFSPDNKFIFIKGEMSTNPIFMIFSPSGKVLLNEREMQDLFSRFGAKYTNYKVTDVTGWAAPGLLIVNTDDKDGNTGPSFWFDVPTKTFIRLSTRFN